MSQQIKKITYGKPHIRPSEKYKDEEKLDGFFLRYCQMTSLHGFKYLDSEKGMFRKLIWIAVLIGVFLLSGLALNMNLDQFMISTTRTSIASTTSSLREIIFPSVYICNVNQVTKSFLSKLDRNSSFLESKNLLFKEFIDGIKPNDTEDPATLAKISNNLKTIFGWNESVPFLKLSSHKCVDMLVLTSYNYYTLFERKFYETYLGITDYGACCVMVPYLDFVNNLTINLDPEEYTGEHFHSIPYGARFSVKRGLKLILDVESFDYAYFPRGARGFKVALSDARDKAVVNQEGYYVNPGTETLAALIPSMINTTSNALSRFEPDKRKCFQDQEFNFNNLKYSEGYRYSNKNCLYEAIIEKIITECKCLPNFAMGRKPSGKIKSCQGRQLNCALDWVKLMGNKPDPDLTQAHNTDNKLLRCDQRCEFQYEAVLSSSSSWPSRMFYYRTDYCYVLQKIVRICNDSIRREVFEKAYGSNATCNNINNVYYNLKLCNGNDFPNYTLVVSPGVKNISEFLFDYAKTNVAILKIFINYPFYTKMSRDEDMSLLSFIANAGGLLGLCMGLSFVSIFEIFYFSVDALMFKIRKYIW